MNSLQLDDQYTFFFEVMPISVGALVVMHGVVAELQVATKPPGHLFRRLPIDSCTEDMQVSSSAICEWGAQGGRGGGGGVIGGVRVPY